MANKKIIVGEGYNEGDKYEDKIAKILIDKKILPIGYVRAGASDKADVEINFKRKIIKIEIKADQNADYGQKYLKWDKTDKWSWVANDNVTKMYDKMNIIENYINKDFVPKKFTKEQNKISTADKRNDQKEFEKQNIIIPLETLFEYYSEKNCYYIQLENCGFYHLKEDIMSLGTSQFDAIITLRLRAKTINTTKKIYKKDTNGKKIRTDTGIPTPWNYGFLGVIKMYKKPSLSQYDLEELDGREFPFKD